VARMQATAGGTFTPIALAAAALLAGGCGADGEQDPVASATVTAAATTSVAPTGTTTSSRGERTTTASRGRVPKTTPRGTGTTTSRGAGTTTTRRGEGTPPPPPPPATTTKAPVVKIPAARAKLGRTQRFAGTGDKVLGTVKLDRNSVVRWTVSGSSFELRDGSGKLKISGKDKTGQSFAAGGSYSSVKVSASGRWTLSFTSLGS
jgi:hypothetical protein